MSPAKLHSIDSSRSHLGPKCGAHQVDFAHMTWTCVKVGGYWKAVYTILSRMIQLEFNPMPEVALLGYVRNFPKHVRRFVAIALLLAKRELAIKWGNGFIPTTKARLNSLIYCNTNCDLFATMMPSSSRPKDIWGPLKSYLLEESSDSTSQPPDGIVPTGVGRPTVKTEVYTYCYTKREVTAMLQGEISENVWGGFREFRDQLEFKSPILLITKTI